MPKRGTEDVAVPVDMAEAIERAEDAEDIAAAREALARIVAEAIREHLDRRAVAAAAEWHASLTGEDAAAFADFNAAW